MSIEGLSERLGRVEESQKIYKQQLEALMTKNEVLVELKAMVKMQTEINKDQNSQMKEFSQTLGKINENLTHLNISQNQIEDKMNNIGERLASVEESQEGNKIDVPKLLVKVIIGIVMLLPTIVLGYIQLKMK